MNVVLSVFLLIVSFSVLFLCWGLCQGLQCWVFVAVCRLSLVVASRGCALVGVRRLFIVASLVAEHGL